MKKYMKDNNFIIFFFNYYYYLGIFLFFSLHFALIIFVSGKTSVNPHKSKELNMNKEEKSNLWPKEMTLFIGKVKKEGQKSQRIQNWRAWNRGIRGGVYNSQRKSVTEVLFRHNKIYFYLLTPETHFYSMSNKMGTNFHTKKFFLLELWLQIFDLCWSIIFSCIRDSGESYRVK